ncbi:MAG: hypothetical protein KGQ42_03560 [Alphaproteobacteria bacterium]|nr:hypothetical protein [Alphaproteobacteria bacterium]MDE2041519.1 hypothetical protein [Alphaproteobacteria bacterium]MDE2340038.1 hypothetical protein [Alphaproteobacteria bacterium]
MGQTIGRSIDARLAIAALDIALANRPLTLSGPKGKNADRPDVGAFYIFGVVKIVDDEFRSIDHISAILPPGTRSGWA